MGNGNDPASEGRLFQNPTPGPMVPDPTGPLPFLQRNEEIRALGVIDHRTKADAFIVESGARNFVGYGRMILERIGTPDERPGDKGLICRMMLTGSVDEARARFEKFVEEMRAATERGGVKTITQLQGELRAQEVLLEGRRKELEILQESRNNIENEGARYYDDIEARRIGVSMRSIQRRINTISARIALMEATGQTQTSITGATERQRDFMEENRELIDRTVLPNPGSSFKERILYNNNESSYRFHELTPEERETYRAAEKLIVRERERLEAEANATRKLEDRIESALRFSAHVAETHDPLAKMRLSAMYRQLFPQEVRDAAEKRDPNRVRPRPTSVVECSWKEAVAIASNPHLLNNAGPDLILGVEVALSKRGKTIADFNPEARQQAQAGAEQRAQSETFWQQQEQRRLALERPIQTARLYLEELTRNGRGESDQAKLLRTWIETTEIIKNGLEEARQLKAERVRLEGGTPEDRTGERYAKVVARFREIERWFRENADTRPGGIAQLPSRTKFSAAYDLIEGRAPLVPGGQPLVQGAPAQPVQQGGTPPAVNPVTPAATPPPATPAPATPAAPSVARTPDRFTPHVGMSMAELDATFTSFSQAMAEPDEAKRNTALAALRPLLGSITEDQKENLRIIVGRRFKENPQLEEFLNFIDSPHTTAYFLLHEMRALAAREARGESGAVLSEAKDSLTAHVAALSADARNAVLDLVAQALERRGQRNLDTATLAMLDDMRQSLSGVGGSTRAA